MREGEIIIIGWLVVNFLCVLVNVCITALNIKLYTEYFKDRSANNRSSKHENSSRRDKRSDSVG